MANLPKTKFLIKNHINFTDQFRTYINNNRIYFPSVLEGDDNDEFGEVIDRLESANNNPGDFSSDTIFGVTYDVHEPKSSVLGHWLLDYMGGTEIYVDPQRRLWDPNVKKFFTFKNSENYDTPRNSPRKKGGKRRKKKTRRKRGGMKKLHQKGEEDFKYNPNKTQKKKNLK